MPWLQLRINSSRELANNIESELSRLGALAVTLQDNADQPIFEPELGETPLWQETRITGLFEASVDTQALLQQVQQRCPEVDDAHWHQLEDKDWEREWMQHFHPIQCADNLWICPSWLEPPEPAAVNLKLDPGLAFGTGTHPTTFLCLQWLSQQDVEGKQLVDYGCGSGILGVAALLLGAESVCGIDIDPQALLATRDNTLRNGLPAESFPVYYPGKCPQTEVDLVLANILAGPLVDLAPTLSALVRPGGLLCLSGILATQGASVEAAYANDFDIEHRAEREEWLCLAARKK